MNHSRSIFRNGLPAAAIIILATAPCVQAIEPLAPELRVNQTTAGDQRYPAVAGSASGGFVVVWESEVGGGSVTDILARRYAPGGVPEGDEFIVNTTTANRQVFPAVAMNDSGQFVVAWDSLGQDGPGLGVYAQRFNADGTRAGNELHVNNGTNDPAARVGAAIDAAGDFVVVWPERKTPVFAVATAREASINARSYAADGIPRSAQVQVGTSTLTNLRVPVVGMTTNGDFVVAWQSDTTQVLPLDSVGSSGAGIYARRYALSGTAYGIAIQVDDGPSRTSNGISLPSLPIGRPAPMSDRPAIAVGPAGDFVVAWQRNLADFTPSGAFARRYSASGAAQGLEFSAGRVAGQALGSPRIAMDQQGRFAIVSQAEGIYLQRFAASGDTLGSTQRLDAGPANNALMPSVIADGSGNFAALWQDFGRDGDGRGIVARRYAP